MLVGVVVHDSTSVHKSLSKVIHFRLYKTYEFDWIDSRPVPLVDRLCLMLFLNE